MDFFGRISTSVQRWVFLGFIKTVIVIFRAEMVKVCSQVSLVVWSSVILLCN